MTKIGVKLNNYVIVYTYMTGKLSRQYNSVLGH